MAVTNDMKLPSDAELTVQEITLSTPYMKAVAVYMHRACEHSIRVLPYFIVFEDLILQSLQAIVFDLCFANKCVL
jgi:hypothetical protein